MGAPATSSMNRVTLLFFATLRDRAGTKTAEMEVPQGMTVRGLKDLLGESYPNLAVAANCACRREPRVQRRMRQCCLTTLRSDYFRLSPAAEVFHCDIGHVRTHRPRSEWHV